MLCWIRTTTLQRLLSQIQSVMSHTTQTVGQQLTDIAGIQGLNVDLDSENGFTQSAAITATSLDVTNTVAGDVELDQNNDVGTVAISNALGDVTYNTNRATTTDIAGIQGVNVDPRLQTMAVSQSAAITATSSLDRDKRSVLETLCWIKTTTSQLLLLQIQSVMSPTQQLVPQQLILMVFRA
jgi:hypothetical protein